MSELNLDTPALEYALKCLIVRETEKHHLNPEDIADDEALFGRVSRVGLDSLDALQISIALQAQFGVRLSGDRAVRKHMANVAALAAFVRGHHG
ncbi:phosphopantetheine-binding protein [Conchiformibius kuhniae]|uniref:Phosphopantetheine-binding protein n=1 Tax=Conchiformibius kuhniae TaxID=211502 RepID=A0ABD8B7D3_9NEIS|nr:phosphopantetheine-binding protein [Conchiformibius kuhniae]